MTTTTRDAQAETKQLAVRLPLDLINRIEKHVGRMRRDNRWMLVTRADAIRALLEEALAGAEQREALAIAKPEATA